MALNYQKMRGKHDREQWRKTGGEGGRLIKGILEMSESESHNQLT